MTVATALADIQTELNDLFYERDDAIEGMLLAVVARQHNFILGPPGTGKSALTREFVQRIDGATYFETLLSKNRPDQAVLGPYDLPLLRDKGEFRRKDAGYLTDVQFAFVDELGKASPTLGHDLLAALNERIKHEVNGERSAVPIPLHTAFAASNEHPAAEGEDGAALWDRLLVRTVVAEIREDRHFKDLMERVGTPEACTRISYGELLEAEAEAARVILLDTVLDGVIEIRSALKRGGINVSDRRWRESMSIVRAHAYLAGRPIADVEDLVALRFTLWDDLEQIKKVERTIMSVASPATEEATALQDAAQEVLSILRSHKGEATATMAGYASEAFGKAGAIEKDSKKLRAKTKTPKALQVLDNVQGTIESIRSEAMQALGMAS